MAHRVSDVEDSVRHTVCTIRKHPLMPKNIAVHGLVIHPTTGKLTVVIDGTEEHSCDSVCCS